jgi:M6 family metalloprotease-like protein
MARLRVFFGLIASSGVMLGALAVGSAAAPERSAEPTEASASRHGVACSAAVKRRRAAALRRYRRKMPAERRAYFRRHRSAKARRAFVRRQNAKLRRLQRALAACSVRRQRSTDLSIAFTEAPAAGAQRRLRYRVTATNGGPLPAAAVNVFVWKTGPTYLVSATGPGTCRTDVSANCHIGSLAVGESKTIEIVLRAGAEGTVTVEADVRAQDLDADSNQANNRAGAVAELRAPAPSCPPALWPGFMPEVTSEGDLGEDAAGHPARGTASVLMLFVDFSDAPANEATATLYQDLVPEADRLFRQTSYGRFGLDVTPLHRWVRMPSPLSQTSALVRDAVAAVDPEVDFRRFSMVVIVLPSTAARQTIAFIVSPGNGLPVDGTEVRHGAVLAGDVIGRRGNSYGARVLFHELAHPLGLPDLYDLATGGDPNRHVGSWDPMGSLSPMRDFLAWHKWKLGWLDVPQVGCLSGPGVVEETLTPVAAPGGPKAIVALTGPSTAIVAEARRPVGADAGICEDGVLVYSVDATVVSGMGPVRVRPAEQDGALQPDCGRLYEAPFDVGPDEVSRFDEPATGVTVEVIASSPDGYRVRVTKR